MNEYEVIFVNWKGTSTSFAYVYGTDEHDARRRAVSVHGIAQNRIKSVTFKERYRGYGHI